MALSHAINGCRDDDDEAAGEKKKSQRLLTLHEGDVLHGGDNNQPGRWHLCMPSMVVSVVAL